jgi:hypothetical protein
LYDMFKEFYPLQTQGKIKLFPAWAF